MNGCVVPEMRFPPSALWRGLSAYAGGDSTATAGITSVECGAGVPRPGYDFFFIRWHSPRQRAQLVDIMALARQVPASASTTDRNLSKTIL
jgi:hypothetical protein